MVSRGAAWLGTGVPGAAAARLAAGSHALQMGLVFALSMSPA